MQVCPEGWGQDIQISPPLNLPLGFTQGQTNVNWLQFGECWSQLIVCQHSSLDFQIRHHLGKQSPNTYIQSKNCIDTLVVQRFQ
ncbi:unnamed protein product [Ixodes pacificus]